MTPEEKKQIEELRARIAALENPPVPKPSGVRPMQPSQTVDQRLEVMLAINTIFSPWFKDMVDAVPTSVVRDIVADHTSHRYVPPPPAPPRPRGTGWVDPIPYKGPPGEEIAGRIIDHFLPHGVPPKPADGG